ncbi:DNA excision repair protein ERCC-1-like [Dorcoceras hygrometricum]|uniref:DNA excision repair protein ERCC-1 n=1 Tax=Dorcoceras hygrometricum TaxID=472368 RepID=A0A2Z7DFH1_9LAMI|nr:DNA excision repair protein ERCC-1-like [Dorcoceras hygrometricum]
MEDAGEPENRRQPPQTSSFHIEIPSYEEVVQPTTTNHSLFNPSSSFSQAFNFVKNSEFYSAPAPPRSQSPSADPRGVVQPEVPPASASAPGPSRNCILVSHRQKGNPLLKHIRNVRWAFADIVCDYMLGQSSCALYLSLRYHLLHPDYLYFRIRELQKKFKLSVVLCHVDVEDVVKPLLEVTKTALLHDCTLLCGWSLEECGRYLETIKVYENKPADLIQGQMDMDYLSRLNHALTTVRHVNKTDVVTLGSTFGSLSHVMDASMEDLARCPGIGERKVKRLYDTFHEPFKRVVPAPSNAMPVKNLIDHLSDSKPTSVSEDEKEVPDARKRRNTDSETSVRSALQAAFAKYSVKNKKGEQRKEEEKNSVAKKQDDSPEMAT